MKNLFTILMLALVFQGLSQGLPKSQEGRFLLANGSVYSHENGLFQADVILDQGKIIKIGPQLTDAEALVIDCKGLEIYPGMIDSGTKLGLAEIGAVSLTQDFSELGEFTPHMQALTAVNPSSVNIPVNRVSGVTTVLSVPSGGLFPGTAALIDLVGYTPDEMYAGFKAALLRFPSSGKKGRRDKRTEEEIEKDNTKALLKLNTFWKNVKAYANIKVKDPKAELEYNPQMDALTDVALGKAPLLIEVNKREDILQAIAWMKKHELKVIFTGVAEGYRVLDSLKKYEIPVITGPILDNPSRDSDHYASSYRNASKMHKAGIRVAIRTNETENVRNLPYNAGFAATYGMGREAAFAAITKVPAEIMGIADQYGSIEEGKNANLFVSNGDPFETSSQILHLFIRGLKVPIESRHTLLYEEFLDRSPRNTKD